MELRLSETMAEAKRHYQSYVDIRSQYNSFIEGRINQMVEHCKNNNAKDTPGMNSIKSQKAKADIIQTLKVNLEAQDEALAKEIQNQQKTYEKVSNFSLVSFHFMFSLTFRYKSNLR